MIRQQQASLRQWARQRIVYAWKQQAREVSRAELCRPALIFAPHPDDETLACGGTIAKKVHLGAKVRVIYMTDGRHSHVQYIEPQQLAALRKQEALAAGRVLGLQDEDAHFLKFEDGRLHQESKAVLEHVSTLLDCWRPEEVYIPYHKEPPADHAATHHIVLAALEKCDLRPVVYEYAIWFWQQWPWTALPAGSRRTAWQYTRDSIAHGFGLHFLRHFRHAVPIADVLAQKEAALYAHKTQMVRPPAESSWPILADVGDGEFLALFLQPYEYFRQRPDFEVRRS
jgi:LmbE family N-acetylglucosaminyl deacetylase